MAISLTGVKPLRLFSVKAFESKVFQKNPHTVLELKTAIQSEVEATDTETLTKVPKNFTFRLHKIGDLRGIIWKTF
jgi:hypothetical protein